jgi:hypothetical protein
LNVSFDGGNFTFKHSGDNYEQGLGVVSDFTEAAYRRNIQLPPRISAWFDPRFGQGEDTRNMFRRFTDYTLQRFGEDATQKFMRQPAFVHVFDKEFQRLKGYGWAEDVARVHATEKATETINWIFFNNNSNTAFLRRMNNIVPFFSAWWEVMSTWAFKIPSQTFMPLGYTALARRVDRFFQGMRETGLIEQDENGQMFLNFQDNLGGNTAGAALSKIGRTMTRTPVTIAEWLGGIGKLAVDAVDGDGIHFDKFEPVDLSAFAKDGFFINVASPLDLSGNTHGVMGINNFQFGLTPVLSYVATQALERSGFAGDIKLKDTEKELPFFSEEGDSILSIIDGNQDISLNQFINLNHDALEEAWGRERLNRIKSGFISGEEVTIPKGTYKVPETSLFTQLIDDTFFPFGRMHTPGEAIVAVTPSTISYILRGLGIHSNDDDPNLITVMLTGMQGAFGEQGQYQVDAEVLKQIQYLEATEGLVSKVQEKAAELRILVTQTVEAGNEIPIGGLEEGLPRILSDDHPRAEEAQDILDDLTRLNSEIVRRAEDNAGWALIVRGITGSLGPSTPRMFFKEQEDAANYWVSRDIAKEAEVRGSVNFARLLEETKVRNFSDLSNALTLVGEWLEDPVGDQAKVFVKENHPSMFSFIQGSTFWGDGGPPPEIGTIEEFFRQVESGERQVYSPDVFVQRVARAEIATDREIAIINEYGDDYLTQAQAQLTDWSKWRDLTEPYSRAYEGLDWMDQTLNDGAYLDFNNRNKDDRSTFYELIRDEFNKAVENVDEVLNAVDFLGLSPDDQRQVSGILNSSTRGIRDAIKEFDDRISDGTFDNKREQLIASYFLNVADPFYSQRNEIYDLISDADDPLIVSNLYDRIRDWNNEQWLSAPVLSDPDSDRTVQVPNELMRAWNGKDDQDKINQKLRWIGQRPEWMTLQATHTLSLDHPDFAQHVPTSREDMQVYNDFAQLKAQVTELQSQNPLEISKSKMNSIISEARNQMYIQLIEQGRGGEVEYALAWPIQRLRMAGKLPPALDSVLPQVNFARQQLEAIEKGPTSIEGNALFSELIRWLEREEFIRNPNAETAIDLLGLVMFDEQLRAAVYPKLLYGDFFGTLR